MALLEISDLSKRFGGVRALKDVSMNVEQGEVHALIGPNGAGKTTLFNCISGLYRPEQGAVRFKGRDITRKASHKIPQLGIARTFQNLELFRNATVLDNIMLGRYMHKRTTFFSEALFLPKARRQEVESRRKVEEAIDFLDLQPYRNRMVAGLPFGIQKCVELARALTLDPELMLLDEPSSGLNPEETQDLCFRIEDIQEELGITVLLVEHDMRVVSEVCDRVTAFDFGEVIARGTPEEVQQHPEVIKAYLGEEEEDAAASA
ncbi:MAG: ABC transporter ATP-binding protein [Proteobacteria bacterium]|nr:ABC transporter ATP-binding protein [Pseudomonadota bacterium]